MRSQTWDISKIEDLLQFRSVYQFSSSYWLHSVSTGLELFIMRIFDMMSNWSLNRRYQLQFILSNFRSIFNQSSNMKFERKKNKHKLSIYIDKYISCNWNMRSKSTAHDVDLNNRFFLYHTDLNTSVVRLSLHDIFDFSIRIISAFQGIDTFEIWWVWIYLNFTISKIDSTQITIPYGISSM